MIEPFHSPVLSSMYYVEHLYCLAILIPSMTAVLWVTHTITVIIITIIITITITITFIIAITI